MFSLGNSLPSGNFDKSKKSETFFKSIFGNDLDFKYDEESQELTLLSPYRNLVVKSWETTEQSNGKVIVIGLGTAEGRYPVVNLRISDPTNTALASGVIIAISIQISQFLEATLGRPLSLVEKNKITGSNVEEVMASMKALAGTNPVIALVEFYKETAKNAQFSLVQRTRNIAYKESDLDFSKVARDRMTIFTPDVEEEAPTSPYREESPAAIAAEVAPTTPDFAAVTADDDIPF